MGKKKITILLCVPVVLLGILNLLTVFTPEIGFDALWYHLTLPKLWLLKKQWYFDGGLLYYSVMPRLTETIFIPLIKISGFIGPKLIQYLSGIGTGVVIWKISSKLKFSKVFQLVALSLFYATWLVSWQSGSAYIDLFRTFLESLALYFILFGSSFKGGIFLGLAIGTKWLSLGSVGIYALVIGIKPIIPAVLLSIPWFVLAYSYTGNPIYPIFSQILHQSILPITTILKNIIILPFVVTFPYDDFLSPIVGLLVILSVIAIFSRNKVIQKISLIGFLGIAFSSILNPPSSRFMLPYLPALIISATYVVQNLKSNFQKIFIILTIISSVIILSLRIYAIKKYIPFLIGKETQNNFLLKMSSKLPDTFIDSDNYVRDNIPENSKIVIDKLHNLYYFPYNFDHTSWTKTISGYDYLVTKNTSKNEITGDLLHENSAGIQIYKLK